MGVVLLGYLVFFMNRVIKSIILWASFDYDCGTWSLADWLEQSHQIIKLLVHVLLIITYDLYSGIFLKRIVFFFFKI